MLNIFPYFDCSRAVTDPRQQSDCLPPLECPVSRSEVDVGEDVPRRVLAWLEDANLSKENRIDIKSIITIDPITSKAS